MNPNPSELNLFAKKFDYQDRELTFLVHTFHDAAELAPMLVELRGVYPNARLIVCSDGDDDTRLPGIAQQVQAEFHLGENLYAFHRAGAICHRMLELFLVAPTRYMFKVDPDTGFHRRFTFLPQRSGMFGTIQSHELFCSIQGGCFGITLDWAAWLYQNSTFLSHSLADPAQSWAVYPPMLEHCRKTGRVSSDWLFGFVATALGIPQFGFEEVLCRWKTPVDNQNMRYAITHPVQRIDAAADVGG